MQQKNMGAGPVPAQVQLEAVIAELGAGRVILRALVAMLWGGPPRPMAASDLSPHLRRDIGLKPQGERRHPGDYL